MPLDLSFREFLKNKLNFGIYYINFRPYQIQTANIHFKEKTPKIFLRGYETPLFLLEGGMETLKILRRGYEYPLSKKLQEHCLLIDSDSSIVLERSENVILVQYLL